MKKIKSEKNQGVYDQKKEVREETKIVVINTVCPINYKTCHSIYIGVTRVISYGKFQRRKLTRGKRRIWWKGWTNSDR